MSFKKRRVAGIPYTHTSTHACICIISASKGTKVSNCSIGVTECIRATVAVTTTNVLDLLVVMLFNIWQNAAGQGEFTAVNIQICSAFKLFSSSSHSTYSLQLYL